jgi:cAMP phosphodiesterase
MRVRLLPSAPDGSGHQFLTSYLINDTVAIDAGCLGFYGTPADQAKVTAVFITHSHADHVCSLPIFAMNVHDHARRGVTVHSHQHVLDCLRTDVFNGRVWPDFVSIRVGGTPLVQLELVVPGRAVRVDGLSVTAVAVDHAVPTVAYIVDDGMSAVVFSSDSGPTGEVWAAARELPHVKAVFIGVSFPDEELALANASGHLTPCLFAQELAKLPVGATPVVVHTKAAHRTRIVEQLRALGLEQVVLGADDREYVL